MLSIKATKVYLIILLTFIGSFYLYTFINFCDLGIEFDYMYADYLHWYYGGINVAFLIVPVLFLTIYGNKELNLKFKIIDGITYGLAFYPILRSIIVYSKRSFGAHSNIFDNMNCILETRVLAGTIFLPILIFGLGVIAFHFFNLYYLKEKKEKDNSKSE